MNQESETLEFFGPLFADPSKIKREAVRRRKQFDEKSIAAEQIPEYEGEGWQVDSRLKRSIRVKRPKAIDERLENRFWMLLARLGYPEINAGRKFTMLIDRKGAEPLRKQVDVFAKDDETVIVAECKASGSFSRRSLQKDIEEFANLKKPIASAIRRHYGENKKLKIIWLFVTENIIWSTPDKHRATGEQIRIITERELRYYAQVPEGMSSVDAAPLLCAGLTTFSALRNATAKAGDLVAIAGIGGLGHLGIQYARHMGFEVAAIDHGNDRSELAKKLGAHHYIDSATSDPAAALEALGEAQLILVTASSAAVVSQTFMGLRPNGVSVVVGAGPEPIQTSSRDLIFGNRKLEGSLTGNPATGDTTLRFSSLNRISAMIETVPLEQAADAYAKMIAGKARFRMVLTMDNAEDSAKS